MCKVPRLPVVVKLHKATHTVYKTQYHIVWVTRFRRKILVESVAKYLRVKIDQKEYEPEAAGEVSVSG